MAGDTRKWWAPITACPTCNEDAALCPHDQEHPMTSPTQRRHDEILGRLDALIDAMTPGDNQPAPEPVDVTEEPPVGSMVTDEDDDIWRRFRCGWSAWDAVDRYWGAGIAVDCPWDAVRECAPLRLTTDADRERVGLPVDTAPDVDLDEDRAARKSALAAENLRRAEKAEADVERLTRERDDLRARVDDLIRERGQAIERYKALRTSVEREGRAITSAITKAVCSRILARDHERGLWEPEP